LQTALNGTKVVFVDAFTRSQAQFSNPGQYGLTNVKTPACSTTSPANPLQGSSLTCTKASTLTGVDTSAYLFADSVHPTPYGQNLLAALIIQSISAAGIR
jgi:phospholipase/lecithinase/hemolysin